MAIRPVEAVTKDVKLARFLVANPVKNKSLMLMWLNCNGVRMAWMLVDGALEGSYDCGYCHDVTRRACGIFGGCKRRKN